MITLPIEERLNEGFCARTACPYCNTYKSASEQVSPSQPRECSQFLLTYNTLHVQRHQPHPTIWILQSYCCLVLRATTD